MDLKAIGRRIKAAREVKGLTQEALAELVNFKPHYTACGPLSTVASGNRYRRPRSTS